MLRVSVGRIGLGSRKAPGLLPLSRGRGMRGQAFFEILVSLIVFMTMLLAVIQMALAAYSYHFISEAAREGARWAMVRGSACTSFTTACPAATTDIQNYVTGLNYPGINTAPSAMTVTASWCGPTSSTPPACSTGTNAPGQIVRVAIQYRFPVGIPFVPASTITMNVMSQMVISQ
ncbi:MAG: TadE family protein [Candidatus Sulfotelmatobacter sp.]